MKDKRSYQPDDRMLDLVRNDSELILVMGCNECINAYFSSWDS